MKEGNPACEELACTVDGTVYIWKYKPNLLKKTTHAELPSLSENPQPALQAT
jgi:hypothetical protein